MDEPELELMLMDRFAFDIDPDLWEQEVDMNGISFASIAVQICGKAVRNEQEH